MNRLLALAFAAALAPLAAGCADDVIEIRRVSPPATDNGGSSTSTTDSAQLPTSSGPPLAFPVSATSAPAPLDPNQAKLDAEDLDLNTGEVRASVTMPPALDPTIANRLDVTNQVVTNPDDSNDPSIGATPLVTIGAAPTRANAAASSDGPAAF
jgi:hypothetical protein